MTVTFLFNTWRRINVFPYKAQFFELFFFIFLELIRLLSGCTQKLELGVVFPNSSFLFDSHISYSSSVQFMRPFQSPTLILIFEIIWNFQLISSRLMQYLAPWLPLVISNAHDYMLGRLALEGVLNGSVCLFFTLKSARSGRSQTPQRAHHENMLGNANTRGQQQRVFLAVHWTD